MLQGLIETQPAKDVAAISNDGIEEWCSTDGAYEILIDGTNISQSREVDVVD